MRLLSLFFFSSALNAAIALKATVFGASGGVGQLICKSLLQNEGISSVTAVSRNIETLRNYESEFGFLKGCSFAEADALKPETLRPVLAGTDYLVISVGTTAFPTKKWQGGNDPKTACYTTVDNILQSVQSLKLAPKKVVLLSSIGVERPDMMPFKILNSFGVLDAKRESEDLLFQYSDKIGFDAVVVRPGRLVGAPFTNFDLAKLFNVDQGENKGIVIDTRDVLAGDVERADVANAISRLMTSKLGSKKVKFAMINKPGPSPSETEWGKLLSLFTVPADDLLCTRSSD
jgi:nucleoside-diphosphate-sugar epimerase